MANSKDRFVEKVPEGKLSESVVYEPSGRKTGKESPYTRLAKKAREQGDEASARIYEQQARGE